MIGYRSVEVALRLNYINKPEVSNYVNNKEFLKEVITTVEKGKNLLSGISFEFCIKPQDVDWIRCYVLELRYVRLRIT